MPVKLNGPKALSLKGHTFDPRKPESLPDYLRELKPEVQATRAAELNERYRIVETCAACQEPLIAEELMAHRLSHVSGGARAMVGTILNQTPEVQRETLALLKELLDG